MKFLTALFTLIIFCLSAQADIHVNEETAGRIDTLVSSRIPWTGDTPAYSILVDQGGEVVYERNIGFADIGSHIPASRNTVYKIGSITKSYTALAVLQLVEKGRIELDAKVSRYLEDLSEPAAGVTVRQLLTHTSGIPNYTSLPEARPMLAWVVTTRDDIVDLFVDKPLEFVPGTSYSYSNSGYYLLGLIVEAVTGQEYFDYLKANIFEPLGLEATYPGAYEEIVPQQARGYVVAPDGFENAPPTPQLTPFSAGTLEASAADLVRYRRAVFRSGATSEKLRELVITTGTFPDGVHQRYALGALTISNFYGHRRLGHSGGITGFSSHHDYYPDQDITVVVLVNADGAPISPGNLAVKIAREIFSAPQPEEAEAEVSQQVLEAYVGKYRMSPFRLFGQYARIVLNDGALQLQLNDDEENPILIPLLPRGNGEFVLAIDDELRLRFIEESGAVSKLELITSSGAQPGYRVPASQP